MALEVWDHFFYGGLGWDGGKEIINDDANERRVSRKMW